MNERTCHRCGVEVPLFPALSTRDHGRIIALAMQGQRILAMTELRVATTCTLAEAKAWVNHNGNPNPGPSVPSQEAETRGPMQGPLEHPDGPSGGSSRGDRKITEPQDRAFRSAGPARRGRGAGPDPPGDRQHKGQQSERRCLTRRCSGLASLAAELHSLGIARDRLARAGRVRLRPG